jgi:WD40 repeat protein
MTEKPPNNNKSGDSRPIRTYWLTAGAAAIIVAVIAALAALKPWSGTSSTPPPTPSQSATVTPTPSPDGQAQACTDLTGSAPGVTSLAFSNDGNYLVGGDSSGHIYLWDLATQQIAAQFQDPATQGIRAVAFNPDGQFAALDANGHIYLYGHSLAATFTAPGVTSLAFSNDGSYLADANPNDQVSLCRVNSS